ncbi:MAG: glycoside hydrolase family 3 C-terminal domain-containing protein [Opitutales bacterium]|nr:glycoside hydrolase family 3 C-terminal domain-containing protein [Opitutales bacterium]
MKQHPYSHPKTSRLRKLIEAGTRRTFRQIYSPVISLFAIATVCAGTAMAETPAYLDSSIPQEARIDDLVSRMTLEEKASMMKNSTPGVPRLGIPKYDWWSEALHGVANAGHATVFPQAIGLAAMWDAPLQKEIAAVIGVEARAKFNGYKGTPEEGALFHGLTFWSPNVNIFRDPRWGRGQETYGEDPYLTATLGVAFVQGLQGSDPKYLTAAACAKHFAVHSGPESLRHSFDAVIANADLYDTYLPAFEALVKESRVEVVMTAYNAIDGTPCSIHPKLYGLLNQWGFNGHVTSDCGSAGDLIYSYKLAADAAEASALVLNAGMNVVCGSEPEALVKAVNNGLVDEATVDMQLKPLLRTLFRLGLFDPADEVPFNAISPSENDTPEHSELSLVAARKSMVLLKNDGILPLDTNKVRRVLIVGPNADSVPALVGNYCGEPSKPVTVLAGLKKHLEEEGVKVDYAYGCDYALRSAGWRAIPQPWFRGEYFSNSDLAGEPMEKRTERPICFECGADNSTSGGMPKSLPPAGISARWNGELTTTISGNYQFRVRARGGFRLSVNGKTVIDSWEATNDELQVVREIEASSELPENASLPIRLEYKQGDGPVSLALEWIPPAPEAHIANAVAMAKDADAVIYVGGLTAQLEGEEMAVDYIGFSGGDRTSIELPPLQERLIKELCASGKPLVIVNMSGSAVALTWEDAHANAILQAWYPGQQGGNAVAQTLLGISNPSGRLPLTFYRQTEDLPDFTNYEMADRTYKYFQGTPLYPFGHGLSYTSFAYSNMTAKKGADGLLHVSVEVKNTGKLDGEEVVQLYALAPESSSPREIQSLCAFERTFLKAGETRVVNFIVTSSALRRWCEETNAYVTPKGKWTIRASASALDIRQSVTVDL